MSCDRHTDAIVDHACGAEIAAEAAAHLDGCAACRRMFDEQLRLVRDLDGQVALALPIEPSPRFVPEAMARVDRAAVGAAPPCGGAARQRRQPFSCSSRSARCGPASDGARINPRPRLLPLCRRPSLTPTPSPTMPSASPGANLPADRFASARGAPAGHRGPVEPVETDVVVPASGVAGAGALPGPRARWRTRRVNASQLGRDRRCRLPLSSSSSRSRSTRWLSRMSKPESARSTDANLEPDKECAHEK